MSSGLLRPGSVAAGAVVVGAGLVVVQPEHAPSIVRLTLVTVAAGAGLWALLTGVPTRWWISPFDRAEGEGGEEEGSDELERIREKLSGRRRPMGDGPPMPAATLRLLRPLVEVAAERHGLEPNREPAPEASRGELSHLTRAVLASDPRVRPPWYRMRRSDEREVAAAVHRVLDDLERLAAGGRPAQPTDATRPPASP